jgi:hypothetical protein
MDAKSFATYLNGILKKEAQKYEGNLLSVSFDNITEAKRCGGIRDTLVGIADSLPSLVSDFYNKNNQGSITQENKE